MAVPGAGALGLAGADLAVGPVMRLGLSSGAIPDAGLSGLIAAATRRGLAALELREGDAHGLAAGANGLSGGEAAERIAAAGLVLTGFRTSGAGDQAWLARLSESLRAPLLLDCEGEVAGRLDQARALAAAGAAVVVVVRGRDAPGEASVVRSAGLPLAWDADPGFGRLGPMAEALLGCCQGRLHQICLLGGGPEADLHRGAGIGHLMRDLALGAWPGSLILAPSSPRFRLAWAAWLGRRGGWGCGSAASDTSLLSLTGPPRGTP